MRRGQHLTALRVLVQAMSTWSVKTRRAPSRHCTDARVYGHATTAMDDMSTPPHQHRNMLTPLLFPPRRKHALRAQVEGLTACCLLQRRVGWESLRRCLLLRSEKSLELEEEGVYYRKTSDWC